MTLSKADPAIHPDHLVFKVTLLICLAVAGLPWSEPFLCRITALMGSVVAGAGVNPADQRWGFWPLLPLGSQLQGQV